MSEQQSAEQPSMYQCWVDAGGGTPDYDGDEYLRLLRHHRLLLAPGDEGYEEATRNLPCGWPHR